MAKEKAISQRSYDDDGYKKRAACVCVKNENENEVIFFNLIIKGSFLIIRLDMFILFISNKSKNRFCLYQATKTSNFG